MALAQVNIEERKKWDIRPGNTVRVWQKVKEAGGKTRLQAFEGLIIAHKHGFEPGATFTVRKVSGGIGVERIFPLFSPNIEKIEIVKRAKARRAKLYYIREKAAKAIRKKMKLLKSEKPKVSLEQEDQSESKELEAELPKEVAEKGEEAAVENQ